MQVNDRSVFHNGEMSYCGLIAEVGCANAQSPAWWASTLSSKNFGDSSLWRDLQAYLAEGTLEQKPESIFTLLKVFAYQLYRVFLLAPLRLRAAVFLKKWKNATLFFSHLSRRGWESEEHAYEDPYWQPLLRFLAERKTEYLIVNHTISDEHFVRERLMKQSHGPTLLPIEVFMTPLDLFRAWWCTVRTEIRLPEEVLFSSVNIAPLLRLHWERERRSGHIFRKLCIYYACRRMMKAVRPDIVLWPWENHGWERLMMLAARQMSPGTKLIGYQHAAIPLFLLNHFPGRAELDYAPFPDRILTVGSETLRLLQTFGHFPENCLQLGCALRYQYLYELPPRHDPIPLPPVLGMALPINLESSVNMLRMIIECAGKLDASILVKSHPALPEARLQAELAKPLPDNVSFFEGTSPRDFLLSCDILASSESTMAFEAAMIGIPYIYLDTGKGPAGDPAFALEDLKWVAADRASLVEALEAIHTLPPDDLNRQRSRARDYVKTYFRPVTAEAMEAFFNA